MMTLRAKLTIYSLVLLTLAMNIAQAQTITNNAALSAFASEKHNEYLKNLAEIEAYAQKHDIPIFQEFPDHTIMEMEKIVNGKPLYNITTNLGGAQTTRTNKIWPGGRYSFDLTGSGYDKLAMWGSKAPKIVHQEYNGRITQVDGRTDTTYHATHVAGTLIATGINPNAKGMAYEATLDAYDYLDDKSEMPLAVTNDGIEVSNHSYVSACGWFWGYWHGDETVSSVEDYRFGFYSTDTRDWDQIAYDAPFFLICKAAGNDRDDDGTNPPEPEKDGGSDGYDCIPHRSVAKNILTVGAVNEVTDYTSPADVVMSDFSSWGPADDGRIKPDIVAKGVNVFSSTNESSIAYDYSSGTSMATPTVSGTSALLQQHYQNKNFGTPMRSATLKGLIIHTADEAGTTTGPDYSFGWGLMNAERAAQFISNDSYGNYVIDEQLLLDGNTFTTTVHSDGIKQLKVTICWTDPPGIASPIVLNPRTPRLVNDLDLKLTENGSNYYPWKLDYNNPANGATNNSENNIDNIEQVYIASPIAGDYVIEVSHDGSLTGGNQAFSIIVSGHNECTPGTIIYNTDTGDFNFCEDGLWVKKRN